MKKYYLFLLGLCVLLVSCGSDPNDDPAFAPVVNLSPKYFMTVKGFIDPSLSKGLNLQIITRYITNNPSCNYTVNSFEGVDSERTRDITLIAQPDSQGDYVVKVPLDHFLAGKCDWQIQSIEYFMKNSGYSSFPLATFNIENTDSQNLKKSVDIEIVCDENLNCNWVKFAPYDINIFKNDNYIYQINIKRESEE